MGRRLSSEGGGHQWASRFSGRFVSGWGLGWNPDLARGSGLGERRLPTREKGGLDVVSWEAWGHGEEGAPPLARSTAGPFSGPAPRRAPQHTCSFSSCLRRRTACRGSRGRRGSISPAAAPRARRLPGKPMRRRGKMTPSPRARLPARTGGDAPVPSVLRSQLGLAA